MKTKIFITVLALTATGLVVGTAAGSVSAQGSTTNWIQTLAQKLGVSEDKVQSALTDMRSQKRAVMQSRLEERLTQAVADGKITEAQKQAILTRHKDMQTKREAERAEWQSWLTANGLDKVDLGFGFGGHLKMGRGMHGW